MRDEWSEVCGPNVIRSERGAIWPVCVANLLSGLFTNGTGPFVKFSKGTRFHKRDGTLCFGNVPCKAVISQLGQSRLFC